MKFDSIINKYTDILKEAGNIDPKTGQPIQQTQQGVQQVQQGAQQVQQGAQQQAQPDLVQSLQMLAGLKSDNEIGEVAKKIQGVPALNDVFTKLSTHFTNTQQTGTQPTTSASTQQKPNPISGQKIK